ncbi:DUF1338 domain-containing protein [Alteromonas sp. C1M14]|uniref:DUF1338 domain-containing protein n=1 Tax=Alteromonas sp. C1M14 TaxID=2841567 RepID=UPI001C09B140|nr:DUF1338 domain-containing protein [Alteromonas sp. C1M14]MBU2978553.1 DUF1338 domain-containing protein [Alteromonas sp. C1M14]
MTYSIHSFFHTLWQDYLQLSPSAEKVHQVIQSCDNNADVRNDHVAFRTFNLAPINLDRLTPLLVEMGYIEKGSYDFPGKHLRAKHFEYPNNTQPKIFISELLTEALSTANRVLIKKLVSQISAEKINTCSVFYAGRLWPLRYDEYQQLLCESEYAAWTAAWGFHANHFTVSVNHLEQITSLPQLNTLLKDNGFVLNQSGGEIKGGAEVLLAQSSTMADRVKCTFSDGDHLIPGCFYEFAQRFTNASGQRYEGFIAASADKIFESTDAQ